MGKSDKRGSGIKHDGKYLLKVFIINTTFGQWEFKFNKNFPVSDVKNTHLTGTVA